MDEPAIAEDIPEAPPYVRPNFPPLGSILPPVPFPEALKERRIVDNKDLFETFSKCEVNIPLLKLVQSISKYARFLKGLCTIKRNQKLKGKKNVKVSERVSAVFQKHVPKKCTDPGMVSIPCTIVNTEFKRATLDLSASINVLPFSLYKSLGIGPLHKTGVVVQLTDRSNVYPKGVVEDVLVKVDIPY